MTDEFPDIPATFHTTQNSSTSSTTVLPSGLTVVTEDASSTSTVTLTFPTGGSGSETASETGAALANKYFSFKSGSGMSSLRILRTLEDAGAVPFSTAGRTSASLGFTVAPEKAASLLPLLTTECSFENWDVREVTKTASVVSQEAANNPQLVLTEQLYAAAYGAQSALGKSFYAAAESSAAVESFRGRNYGVGSAVLSATGVPDHAAFCEAVTDGLADANAAETTAAPSVYVGGESRLSAPATGLAHLAVALEAPAAESALRSVAARCLALSCPDHVSAFTASGLVGVYGSSSADAVGLVDAVTAVLASSAVTDESVARAKTLAKADALFRLDVGSKSLSDAMTASVLETGGFDAEAVAASYDAVTTAQVGALLAKSLKSNPSVAAIGDLSGLPYQADIKARFS